MTRLYRLGRPVVIGLPSRFGRELNPGIVQMRSSEYRNSSQLRDGGGLIVGAGNSGAEIGLEVARTPPTWMSGWHV